MFRKLNLIAVAILLIFMGLSLNGIAQVVVFEDQFDDLTNWNFVDNSGTATFTVDNTGQLSGPNSGRFDIVDGGAQPWNIFITHDLPLEAFQNYNFSFMLKASTDTAQIRCLFELAGSPYTARIDQTVIPTTAGQSYSFDYTFDGTMVPTNQIKFQVGGATNNNTTIWLDSVVVTATHTQAQPVAGNMILNPEFDDGLNNWNGFFNGSGNASVDDSGVLSGNNSLKVEIIDGGPNVWDAQQMTVVPLNSIYDYYLSFWGVASDSFRVGVLFEELGAPYTRRLDEVVYLTPEIQFFEFTLDSNTVIDPTNQLKFHIGGQYNNGKTAWIDFVVVTSEEYVPPIQYSFESLDGSVTGIVQTDGLQGVSWVDYDNDGDMDLYQPGSGNPSILWRNEYPALMFTDVSAQGVLVDSLGGAAYGPAWTDIDNDGDMDLLHCDGGLRLYRNDGTTFTDISDASGVRALDADEPIWGATLGDYDQDGDVDIAYAGSDQGAGGAALPTRILNNDLTTGSPVFTNVADAAIGFDLILESWVPMWVDVDNDGDQDLWMATIRTPNEPCALLINEPGLGELNWQDPAATGLDKISGITAEWADFNNDGYMDLYAVPFSGDGGVAQLFRNNGDLTFTDVAPGMGIDSAYANSRGVTWGDYDNDGDQDLLISRRAANPSELWRNDGNIFTKDTLAGMPQGEIRYCQFVDYNRDGFLDIYLGVFGGEKYLLRNRGNDNHWIGIKPQGVTNNRAGIGARIKVVAGSLSQIRDIQAGAGGGQANGYLWGQFGLGNATTIDSVIVYWPNGLVDETTDVPSGVDHYYWFIEGTGLVTGIEDNVGNILKNYTLYQNYPNPFNPTTTISFTLPIRSDVRLVLVNILGQVVQEITTRNYPAGTHKVQLDGSKLASGIYFYKLEAGDFVDVKKLVLLK